MSESTTVDGLMNNGLVNNGLVDEDGLFDNLGLVNYLVLDNGLENGLDSCLSDVLRHKLVHKLSVVLHLSLGNEVVLGNELFKVFGNGVMVG